MSFGSSIKFLSVCDDVHGKRKIKRYRVCISCSTNKLTSSFCSRKKRKSASPREITWLFSTIINHWVHYSWCLRYAFRPTKLFLIGWWCVRKLISFSPLESKKERFILFTSFHFDRYDRLDSFGYTVHSKTPRICGIRWPKVKLVRSFVFRYFANILILNETTLPRQTN